MITSINEWKKKLINENDTPSIINAVSSNNNTSVQPSVDVKPIDNIDFDKDLKIKEIAEYAVSLEMTKGQTINIVSTVFVDPSQAPEDISVAFVQDNLESILNYLKQLPEEQFSTSNFEYTNDIENNDLPFECVMYVPNNKTIEKLTETLNLKIKKEKFKAIYENNVFFINSLESLNENNKIAVLNILKNVGAKNISNNLQWKRKIK